MFWILNSIFLNEGRQAWHRQGQNWETLSRSEQWAVAWSHGPRELWHTLVLVKPVGLTLSVLFWGLTIVIGVFRWRMVMRVQGLELALGRAMEISFIAHFFNSFLLGSTGGDLLKAYYAARETHHKKTEAVVAVFVDRLLGLLAMLLFAAAMMLPNLPLLFDHARLAVVAWLILAMLAVCGVVVGLSFWGGLSRRWPQARALLRRLPKGDLLERCVDACRRFGRERKFLIEVMALSMVLNAVCVLQIMALAWGMKLAIPPLALFVIVPIIICIAALPITPSGLGVRENLYVLMLSAQSIAVPATQALSLSLLAYACSLFWSVIGGLFYVGLKERRHLAEVTPAEPARAGQLD
ncbi:MAG TPA: lysylphosphatidylglycerol synthase transmembrane domain-containing protein [Candidatus Eisenbacteria bacterium]|nr:lysylphosphatidylglycerol synthase transmembrane domain-containing protein [Candidatus Eisenbacteria bacterium]